MIWYEQLLLGCSGLQVWRHRSGATMVAFSPPPYCQEEELCLPTLVTQFLAEGCNKLDTPLSRHRKFRMHYSMPQSCVGRSFLRDIISSNRTDKTTPRFRTHWRSCSCLLSPCGEIRERQERWFQNPGGETAKLAGLATMCARSQPGLHWKFSWWLLLPLLTSISAGGGFVFFVSGLLSILFNKSRLVSAELEFDSIASITQ